MDPFNQAHPHYIHDDDMEDANAPNPRPYRATWLGQRTTSTTTAVVHNLAEGHKAPIVPARNK